MGTITKKDLIDYLRKSPENLNFNIFNKMLDDYKKTYEIDDEIKQAIENLYEKMIGEPATDQESISGIINELADNYTAPETDLSDYYTKEETDAAIASAGGGDTLIVKCDVTLDDATGNWNVTSFSSDYSEIKGAIEGAKVVVIHVKKIRYNDVGEINKIETIALPFWGINDVGTFVFEKVATRLIYSEKEIGTDMIEVPQGDPIIFSTHYINLS